MSAQQELKCDDKIKRLLIAGNHLANALTMLVSDSDPLWNAWTRKDAEKFCGTPIYDVWIAWRTSMDVSIEVREEQDEVSTS